MTILLSSLSNSYAQNNFVYNNKNNQQQSKVHSMNMDHDSMVDCGKTITKKNKCEECNDDCSEGNCSDHDCSNCSNCDNISYCITNEINGMNFKKHSEENGYLSRNYYQYDTIFKPPQIFFL